MYVWDILWSNDDTKEAPMQCRREGFAILDVRLASDQRCTSGIKVFGNNYDTKKGPIPCRSEGFATLQCGGLSITDVRLGYTLE